MISIHSLSKSFATKNGSRTILSDVSFSIPDNCFTTIFGPNGCGKTTLLNIITGLDKDYHGAVTGLATGKHQIGYVFQDYRRSLLPWCSVKENILFPLNIQSISKQEQNAKLDALLASTSINLDLNQRVFSLSGGQAQAVCILRALIINPRLLILDEPFAALDYETTISLRRLVSDIAKAMKLTVLFISHDLEEAIALGDQVVFLSKSPTKVIEVLPVNLSYPRSFELATSREFNELRERAVSIFSSTLLK